MRPRIINILTAALIGLSLLAMLTPALAQEKTDPRKLRKALFWEKRDGNNLQCGLCPRKCVLAPGQKGFCRARKNIDGQLYTLTYGQPVALHIDPIEKKPLAHVYPGTKSFSIATAGCNLRCKFCQNWEISQLDPEITTVDYVPPEEIVKMAKESGSKTIAFTYTEPTIFYEYMLDVAKLAEKEFLPCVMHSAGFINEKPLRQLAKYLIAANIDLKGFSEKFYASFCEGQLQAVLDTLKILDEEGVWIEVTNLIIPGVNDSDEDLTKLCRWIKENLGEETPIHFSRFFPMYRLTNLSPTPIKTLYRARDIAKREGLKFIYIGNVPIVAEGENTTCPNCGKTLIRRLGYNIIDNNIKNGKCKFCGEKIPGVWD